MIVATRSYSSSDKSFIMSTMLKGIYFGVANMNLTPKDEFFKHYGKELEAALDNNFLQVKIAYESSDPDLILGYLVTTARSGALVWCYTKAAFRKQGVLRSLIQTQTFPNCIYTTASFEPIRDKLSLTYVPWRS